MYFVSLDSDLCSTLMVSCQKGPTRHAYAWQIGPFWQDKLDFSHCYAVWNIITYWTTSSWHSTVSTTPLIARFMGPTWGPPGADRTQVGPMLAPWTLLSGSCTVTVLWNDVKSRPNSCISLKKEIDNSSSWRKQIICIIIFKDLEVAVIHTCKSIT